MLVLTRNPGERIIVRIPECDLTFSVCVDEIRCGKVRIGFEGAPKGRVIIDREEVYLAKAFDSKPKL